MLNYQRVYDCHAEGFLAKHLTSPWRPSEPFGHGRHGSLQLIGSFQPQHPNDWLLMCVRYLSGKYHMHIYIYTHYFMMMMMMVIVFYYYCVFLLLSLFILLLAYVYTYVNVSQGRRKIPHFRSCLETSKRHRAHISHSYLHIPIYGYIPLKINSYPWTIDITSINIH